jgi:LytS/YehU family sensor histidine kinase
MFKKSVVMAVVTLSLAAVAVSAEAKQNKVSQERFKACKEAAIEKLEIAGWYIKDFMYINHVVLREDTAELMCSKAQYKINKLTAAPYKELIKKDVAEQEEMSKSN